MLETNLTWKPIYHTDGFSIVGPSKIVTVKYVTPRIYSYCEAMADYQSIHEVFYIVNILATCFVSDCTWLQLKTVNLLPLPKKVKLPFWKRQVVNDPFERRQPSERHHHTVSKRFSPQTSPWYFMALLLCKENNAKLPVGNDTCM